MRYITESLADALYKARMKRLNESEILEDEEDLDYNDVDDENLKQIMKKR